VQSTGLHRTPGGLCHIFIGILKCPVHWTPLDSRWTVSYILIEMLKCAVHWTPPDSRWTVSYIHRDIEVSSPLDSTGLWMDCVIYIHRDVEVYSPLDSTRLQLDCLIYIHIKNVQSTGLHWTPSGLCHIYL